MPSAISLIHKMIDKFPVIEPMILVEKFFFLHSQIMGG